MWLLQIVKYACISNASESPVLPSNICIRGLGKCTALNLLIPQNGVVFLNNLDSIIVSTLTLLTNLLHNSLVNYPS